MTTYRIYYNNSTDPQCWSLDEGNAESEICVRDVELDNVVPDFCSNPDGPQPHAWLTVTGHLLIVHGTAVISDEP